MRWLRVLTLMPILAVTLQAQRCEPDDRPFQNTMWPPVAPYVKGTNVKVYEYRGERYAFINRKVARRTGNRWEVAYDPTFHLTEAVINRGRHVYDLVIDEEMVTYEQVPRLKQRVGVVRNPYLQAVRENRGGGGY